MNKLIKMMLDNGLSKNRPYAVRSILHSINNKPLWLTLREVKISQNKTTIVISPSVVNQCKKSTFGVESNFVQFLN